MSFIADKQTIADLNLLGKYKPNSIYGIFNQVRTSGGERLLQEMFQHPLTDDHQINMRSNLFAYFGKLQSCFSFQSKTFQNMETYLGMGSRSSLLAGLAFTAYQKFAAEFLHDEQYQITHSGLLASIQLLNAFRDFLTYVDRDADSPYIEDCRMLLGIFKDKRLGWLAEEKDNQDLGLLKVARYSHILGHQLRNEMEELLDGMYRLDVYHSISQVAKDNGYRYAEALPKSAHTLQIESLRHPGLKKGIANPVSFQKDQNMVFLTGANMAGKSTFMKAFGIAVYLAHMGFPVAVSSMKFSVLEGIYSSINVADDLSLGHSHFYAEVLRVKMVAQEVASGKNLVVLFDELFKGTNVKDAYDGTLSVSEAFSKYSNCFFIISTHIIEVASALRQAGEHIAFAYLPTVMKGAIPEYTYRLTTGVTADRQGMMIIENEGILDLLQDQI